MSCYSEFSVLVSSKLNVDIITNTNNSLYTVVTYQQTRTSHRQRIPNSIGVVPFCFWPQLLTKTFRTKNLIRKLLELLVTVAQFIMKKLSKTISRNHDRTEFKTSLETCFLYKFTSLINSQYSHMRIIRNNLTLVHLSSRLCLAILKESTCVQYSPKNRLLMLKISKVETSQLQTGDLTVLEKLRGL